MSPEHEKRAIDFKESKSTAKYRHAGRKRDKISTQDNKLTRIKYRLLGTFIPTNLYDDFGKVESMIVEVYPHCAIAHYYFRKKDKDNKNKVHTTGPFKIGYSTADLVEKGIVSFNIGYAEVIK